MADQVTPNPGSDEAIEQGCECPVEDNHSGVGARILPIEGVLTPVFVMVENCPLHGKAVDYDWKQAG